MKTITLVRHAKVVINSRKKISAKQMQEWIEEYNHAFVSHEVPNEKVISQLEQANMLLASSLLRTTESLKFIGLKAKEENSLFDEIALPNVDNTFIKLYPKTWLILFRFMMLFRAGYTSEILQESKQRAKLATLYLDRLAKENDNVALMGHGGMNWLLGKQLKKLGLCNI